MSTNIVVWGSNQGNLLSSSSAKFISTPQQISLPYNVVSICASEKHISFVTHDGSLYSYGSNLDGRLGVSTKAVNQTTHQHPVRVPLKGKVKRIESGFSHMCVQLENGEVYAWGLGEYGALGVGQFRSFSTPVKVANIFQQLSQISCGAMHTAFLATNGEVYFCGSNQYGELGFSKPQKVATPTSLSFQQEIVQVSCGVFYTLMLAADGRVFGMGNNKYGQLGIGHKINQCYPTAIRQLCSIVRVTAGYHSGALDKFGNVYIWGSGSFGQYTKPRKFILQTIVRDICIRGFFGLAVGERVYSWGNNTYGELGNGRTQAAQEPIQVEQLRGLDIGKVALGVNFVVMLIRNPQPIQQHYNYEKLFLSLCEDYEILLDKFTYIEDKIRGQESDHILRQQISNLHQKLSHTTKQLQQKSIELQNKSLQLKERTKQFKNTKSQDQKISHLQRGNNDFHQKNQQLQKKCKQLENQCQQFQQRLNKTKQLQNKVAQLQTQNGYEVELNRKHDEAFLQLQSEVQMKVAEEQQKSKKLKQQLNQLQIQFQEHKQNNKKYMHKQQQQQESYHKLQKKLKLTQQQLQKQNQLTQQLTSQLSQCKRQQSAAHLQLQQLNSQLQVTQLHAQQLKNKLKQNQQHSCELQLQLEKVNQKLQNFKKENIANKEHLVIITQKLQEHININQQLSNANKQFAENEQHFNIRINELQQRITELQEQNRAYTPRYEALINRNKQLDKRNLQLSQMVNQAISIQATNYKQKVQREVETSTQPLLNRDEFTIKGRRFKSQQHEIEYEEQPYRKVYKERVQEHNKKLSNSAKKLVDILSIEDKSQYSQINQQMEQLSQEKKQFMEKINSFAHKLKIL